MQKALRLQGFLSVSEATVGFEPTDEGFAEPYCYVLYMISLIARHYPYHDVCQYGFAE